MVNAVTSVEEPLGTGDAPAHRRLRGTDARSLGAVTVALAASVLTFFSAFRPWQGGLLEEWGMAQLWRQVGVDAIGTTLPLTMGRPLHLMPHYLGLALSGGGLVGEYLVLGLVGLGQLWGAYWALGRLTASRGLRLALGLLLALHPWWPAGDLLRYMPAQVAVLGAVVWFGAATRYLVDARARWLALAVAAPLLGLLHYQAPAPALLVAAVCLGVVHARTVRAALTVLGTAAAAVLLSFVWSIVVAPRLAPESYESVLAGAGLPDPVQSVRAVLRTVLLGGLGVVALAAAVTAVVLALGFAQRLAAWRAWSLLAALAVSPLAALVYATSPAHLGDPERVVLPVGLTCWLVLAVVSHLVASDAVLRPVVGVAAVLAALLGGTVAYVQWSGFAAAQQSLLDVVEEVRDEVPPGHTLVVADGSGRFGDVYLLLPPYLDIAVDVEDGPGARTVLCTPDGVVRDHPFAAVYPLPTTDSCTPLLTTPGAVRLGTDTTTYGPVDLYAVPDS